MRGTKAVVERDVDAVQVLSVPVFSCYCGDMQCDGCIMLCYYMPYH